jgi:hypothetical protein
MTEEKEDNRTIILHDLKRIAQAIRYCEHDCFLVTLFDKLYKDVENALSYTDN